MSDKVHKSLFRANVRSVVRLSKAFNNRKNVNSILMDLGVQDTSNLAHHFTENDSPFLFCQPRTSSPHIT